MSYKPIDTRTGATAADDAVVFQIGGAGAMANMDTFQIGCTAGSMDVYGSGDGVNYLATPIFLTDLTVAAPATRVDTAAPTKHYQFTGRYKGIRVLQKGATAVENAYLIATESA